MFYLSNIYLTNDGHIKVGDLGFVETTEFEYKLEEINNNIRDTPLPARFEHPTAYEISSAYLSPEMHCHLINSPEVIVTTKTDIW